MANTFKNIREAISSSQLKRLKKEYEPLRKIDMSKHKGQIEKTTAMLSKLKMGTLIDLSKEDIPVISDVAKSLVLKDKRFAHHVEEIDEFVAPVARAVGVAAKKAAPVAKVAGKVAGKVAYKGAKVGGKLAYKGAKLAVKKGTPIVKKVGKEVGKAALEIGVDVGTAAGKLAKKGAKKGIKKIAQKIDKALDDKKESVNEAVKVNQRAPEITLLTLKFANKSAAEKALDWFYDSDWNPNVIDAEPGRSNDLDFHGIRDADGFIKALKQAGMNPKVSKRDNSTYDSEDERYESVDEGVDIKALAKQFRKNEDENRHTENYLMLAKAFGSKREIMGVYSHLHSYGTF